MIRFTIQRKVFLAIFALAVALAALLVGLTRWNLEQGFGRYVVEAEIGKLDWMVKTIERAYANQGSWDFLQASPEPWDRAVEHAAGMDGRPPRPRAGGDRDFGQPEGMPPQLRGPYAREGRSPPRARDPRPPLRPGPSEIEGGGRPADLLGMRPRLSLRDAAGKVLAGNPRPSARSAVRPIRYQGRTVGTLVLSPGLDENVQDAAFLATQTRYLWQSGLAALLLSLLAAGFLARQFLGPIKALAAGARHIAAGRFSERIAVQSSDELGELASDFNAMAEMLARTEEFRRQWVSDSSHELRTPIAVLRAEIEALQDGVRPADEKTLERLHKHAMQLGKLVDDLRLSLEKDSGQADLELESIDPLALLRETLEEFGARFASADIALDADALPGAGSPWRIRGDAVRLQQVYANLLENTLRYTHAGGRLKISAGARAGSLQLQFDDTAPAPSAQAMPRLFERFFRAEPSRSREHGGSGLGLAICKTIVEGHGGTIAAGKSALGGLCVHIALPLKG